ncbi:hypothetical protein Gpo141_00013693, partial [Globisporangium polare]
FMDANEVDYILRAVHFAASEGWKFLSQFQYDMPTGSWTRFSHKITVTESSLRKLEHF